MFHARAAAAGNERSPRVARRVGGTSRVDVSADRRRCRVPQLTRFVGHDAINKNTTDLAVRCPTGSVEFS